MAQVDEENCTEGGLFESVYVSEAQTSAGGQMGDTEARTSQLNLHLQGCLHLASEGQGQNKELNDFLAKAPDTPLIPSLELLALQVTLQTANDRLKSSGTEVAFRLRAAVDEALARATRELEAQLELIVRELNLDTVFQRLPTSQGLRLHQRLVSIQRQGLVACFPIDKCTASNNARLQVFDGVQIGQQISESATELAALKLELDFLRMTDVSKEQELKSLREQLVATNVSVQNAEQAAEDANERLRVAEAYRSVLLETNSEYKETIKQLTTRASLCEDSLTLVERNYQTLIAEKNVLVQRQAEISAEQKEHLKKLIKQFMTSISSRMETEVLTLKASIKEHLDQLEGRVNHLKGQYCSSLTTSQLELLDLAAGL